MASDSVIVPRKLLQDIINANHVWEIHTRHQVDRMIAQGKDEAAQQLLAKVERVRVLRLAAVSIIRA